ncbi:MAG: lysophospholipase [Candidatus Omnitrophica bacterium]|nr:lysophospholipase [Candidatus Omnitrophota bacterium]
MTSPAANEDKVTRVIYRLWACPSPDAVFLLVHGLGAYGGRWERLASYFLQNSISSYAIDLRGFGETPDAKGHVDSFNLYFKDILALCDIIKSESGGKPIFLVGESMGGLVSFLLAERQPDAFAGLVCLSPAFKSRLKFGWWAHVRILFFWLIHVKRPVDVPFTYAMCMRDNEYIKQMEHDSREHRYATPQLLLHIFFAGLRARFFPGALKIPVLFLAAGVHDVFVDPAAVKKVYGLLQARDKEFIEYPEMFHALSMDLGREQVFQDILRWVRVRMKEGGK